MADVASSGAGGVVHYCLSRPAGTAAAIPPFGRADERRRIADAVALSARAHGAANDRREDRHRRFGGARGFSRHRGPTPGLFPFFFGVDLSFFPLAFFPTAP